MWQAPDLRSVETVRRAGLNRYTGSKTALYDVTEAIRPTTIRPLVRFEGSPGEFRKRDFGQVDVPRWTPKAGN